DLMFALPGQSIGRLKDDLERILAHDPEHLAIYGLTFEVGTPFFDQLQAGQLAEADEELYVNGYRLLHKTMTGAGYHHYEISNFAKPGCQCRH
ncbi:MAG: coproporphyrinogen III oxidase, partial [Desulfuromonadales bacterium]|nr:coproporphyrinogen III oxidase [Desulfuromonadales bacterium]